MTPAEFIQQTQGKRIDDDGAYGVQCVDGFRVLCKALGIKPYTTPNNFADGYWYSRMQHLADFEPISNPAQYKNGDIVIWPQGCASHPASHIAMYYNGLEYGERQTSGREFSLKPTDFSDSLGALRPRAWTTSTEDLQTIAQQVISGRWGNGADRVQRLRDAGYDPAQVQQAVNQMIAADHGKTNYQLAQEVIAGKWGNGRKRTAALKAAGYNPTAVQQEVNRLLAGK